MDFGSGNVGVVGSLSFVGSNAAASDTMAILAFKGLVESLEVGDMELGSSGWMESLLVVSVR